jgi:hypothetical protein
MQRIGLIAWALCVGVGGTVGTLYRCDIRLRLADFWL